ncbi:MAG TPA: cysteine desulfurase family protein [Bacillota bacterium]|nr:cysteine desulfurase family protein [Bacillota bacterium]
MEHIYLDHAATTPVDKQVLKVMNPVLSHVYGNPSSVHAFGRQARKYLDDARHSIAKSMSVNAKNIIFTSGGTEANNLALLGAAQANKDKGNHIITTAQEHHATLHTVQFLQKKGFDVTYLPVYENGQISLNDLREALTDETILVSIMYVNNETGVIQPIPAIGRLLKEHQAYFHTDAVQAFGLLDINVQEEAIDMLSVASHKINGPKGVGFLYAADHVPINPIQFGGEQERKRRPGTENLPGIVGFQKAVELAVMQRDKRTQQYAHFRSLFLETLSNNGIDYNINGDLDHSVPSIVNISFPGTQVEALLANLDLEGVAASSGSACTAGSVEPSHVLLAMFGKADERTLNSVRFSFGLANTETNVKVAAERVAKIIRRLTT